VTGLIHHIIEPINFNPNGGRNGCFGNPFEQIEPIGDPIMQECQVDSFPLRITGSRFVFVDMDSYARIFQVKILGLHLLCQNI